MTKNYSIHTKLIILFVVTFFLVCVLFIVLLKIEGNTYNEEESLKQENLIKIYSSPMKTLQVLK